MDTWVKWWIGGMAVCAVALFVVIYLDYNYIAGQAEEQELLNNAYGVDTEAGEILIECLDGTFDIWYSHQNISSVCGQIIEGVIE